jgi:GT2 family glycosyltransferase
MIPIRGLAIHIGFGKESKNFPSPELSYTEFISGCYICIRLSDLKRLGFLEEKFFLYLEDIEFSARATKKGLKMLYAHQSVIYHKWRGETKLKYETLYYAVRNRLLLIDLVFPKTAKFYFLAVISLKLIVWGLTDRLLFKAAVKGLRDYRQDYFGEIRI